MPFPKATAEEGRGSAYLCRDWPPCSPLVLLQQAAQLVPELHQSLASRKAQSHSIHLLHERNSAVTLWLALQKNKGKKITKMVQCSSTLS